MATVSFAAVGAEIEVAAELVNSAYSGSESSAGLVLDKESGELRGGGVRLSASGAWLASEIAYRHVSGRLQYTGHTQIGIPLFTHTDLGVTEASLLVGPAHGWRILSGSLNAQLGVSDRRIDRDILGTPIAGALSESMQTQSLVGCIQWSLALPNYAGTRLDVSLGYEDPRHQDLAVNSYGAFDVLTLHPAESSARTLGMRWHASLTDAWKVQVGMRYIDMHYGNSKAQVATRSGKPAAVAWYPGSDQRLVEIMLAFLRAM